MTETIREVATLGGGCFWCIEAVLERLDGVERVVSGFAGGDVPNPSYEQVCTGATGHAEVVQVTFDPARVTFRDLLLVFFAMHDPTTLNRQGADVGTQYRSVVYFHSDAQRATAEQVIGDLEADGTWTGIVTELAPAPQFFPAEAHHQQYYRRNPTAGYCQVVIAPKVAKLRQKFAERLRPVTTNT